MGRAHTCGMEVCHFIAVALTVAPLPAPRPSPDSAVDVTAAGVIVHAGGPEPEPPAC